VAEAVAVVVGVGPGLGWALAERFANGGLRVAAAARNLDKVARLIDSGSAGKIKPYSCDATQPAAVQALFAAVQADLGRPDVVVYNASGFGRASILDVTPEDFERSWRVGCMGGFLVGQAAARAMLAHGGTILFTGATASLRGSANFVKLAVPKFGLRALAQAMARELGPRGIHVAHVIIDGHISPETAGTTLTPKAIAETYWQLYRQPRDTWTLELDLRPAVEKF
jgi:NAD(P)-dependent dehydrogenase (short-subunit alcohol dehydrogenase family)